MEAGRPDSFTSVRVVAATFQPSSPQSYFCYFGYFVFHSRRALGVVAHGIRLAISRFIDIFTGNYEEDTTSGTREKT